MVHNVTADNYMTALAQSKLMTHENAPGFVACVEEMAQKAGITGPLHVELVPSNIVNATFRQTTKGQTIGFSEGLLHLFENTNLHVAPNAEVQAIIGHELSHMRHASAEYTPKVALMLLGAGLPLAGMGAMYLIDKTNEKLRENKDLHPDKPQAFWDAFHETWSDVQKAGFISAVSDFTSHVSPFTAKLLMGESPRQTEQKINASMIAQKPIERRPHDEMGWAQAAMNEAKYLAIGAAMTVPVLAANKSVSFAHEFRADKFSVALTGNKAMASALKKLATATEEAVNATAATPLEKNWAARVCKSTWEYVKEALYATHPPNSKRITAIEATNVADAVQHFRL
jgi:Zn-dependent protease with chaperone function